MIKALKNNLIALGFIILPLFGFAQPKTFKLDSVIAEAVSLTDYVQCFEDASGSLSIEQVASPQFDHRFKSNSLPRKKLTLNQEATVWGRFEIHNHTQIDQAYFVNTNFPVVKLYEANATGTQLLQYGGLEVPIEERTIKKGVGSLRILLKAGEKSRYYLHCQNLSRFKFPKSMQLYINNPVYVTQNVGRYRAFFGAFAGIEFMMIVYALALFAVFREKDYLWLCVALGSTILYFMNFFDIARYVFTSEPLFSIFVSYALTFLYIPLMILGQFVFLYLFLDFKKHFSRWMIYVKFLVAITIFWSPVFTIFNRYPLGTTLSNILILATPLTVLLLIISLAKKDNPLAKIMLLSEGIFLMLIIIAQLVIVQVFSVRDYNFTSRIILMAAYIIQSLFWTFAIIYKLVLLRKEKEKAQIDAIDALKVNEKLIMEQNTLLEIKVEERTKELVEKNKIILKEKHRSEELLLNILPEEVAEELKEFGSSKARSFEEVTVMFTDFKGFTEITEKMSAEQLVLEIDTCYRAFDKIIEKHGVEKIKTIGDSYMCAGGLPLSNSTHALDTVRAALQIRDFISLRNEDKKQKGEIPFDIRIGIHTGPVVAGIVGIKKFAYDIWGDTVNTASRIESSGEVGKVNISGSTYAMVQGLMQCFFRGKITAKGKGEIDMYFVEGQL